MRNAGLDETQAGIRIAGRNINNLRYVDDTTLMAESKEELKSLLMKVKDESEKAGIKHNIQKTNIMTLLIWTSIQIVYSQIEQYPLSLAFKGISHLTTFFHSTGGIFLT